MEIKGLWFDTACRDVRAVLPDDQATALIAAVLEGNAAAKARLEKIHAAEKAKRNGAHP